jgi:hypothetical protein
VQVAVVVVGGGIGDVVVVAVVATAAEVWRWWATTYGRWARDRGFCFFLLFFKSLCLELFLLSVHVCRVGSTWLSA